MYASYPRRASLQARVAPETIFVFPSPSESLSDLSEFTLLEGSSLTSFNWSDSETAPTPQIVEEVYQRHSIPLLGFFASLLAIDNTTLDLLERYPAAHSHSPLFPGPPLAYSGEEPSAPDTQHGLFRLLSHRPQPLLSEGHS